MNADGAWTWNELVSGDLAAGARFYTELLGAGRGGAAAPMDIPVGRFTILADPQGAVFTASAVPGGPARGVDAS